MCKREIIICVALLLSLLGLVKASAQDAPDSTGVRLEATLVTCAPGTEAYEVYGHTALRLRRTDDKRQDVVFNYGVFSFSEDNFIWRWTLGETDYSVEILPYGTFCRWYGERGRAVNEQPLNLRQDELQRLAAAAMTDVKAARESGWTYRYNFFYDNCTTRVIDLIEKSLAPGSHIEWPQPEEQTLREMLHQFVEPVSPWLSEGQDLLLGLEVDKPAPMRSQLFSPLWASHYAAQAKVVRPDGTREALVGGQEAPMKAAVAETSWLSPTVVAVVVFVLIFGLNFYRRRQKKTRNLWRITVAVHGRRQKKTRNLWRITVAVHVLQGLVGIPVAILFFWSTHPAVDSNWLIALFNPLWLGMAWLLWRRGKINDWLFLSVYCGTIILTSIVFFIGKIKGQEYPFLGEAVFWFLVLCGLIDDEKE